MAKKKKKILAKVKLQVTGGQATPAPPVGPALGQHGLNIQEFCTKFNEATRAERMGEVVPVEITVFEDRTYEFIMKKPPMAELIKASAKVSKGSGKPLQQKVGSISRAQVKEIALKKLSDLNTSNIEAAMKTVEGTARQMGIEIK